MKKLGITNKQALANYGLISGMAMPLILFPNIIVLTFSNLLIPEFTEFNARSEYSKIKLISKKTIRYALCFSIITTLVILSCAPKISYFIYKSTDVVIYIKMLAPLIPIMYIDSVIDALLKGLDKQVTVLKINILDLLTTITLIYTIIPYFGIIGYIFIIYFSELLNFILSYSAFKRTIVTV